MDVVIAAEDAGLYRDAFGVMPPGGFPEAFLEPVDDALERLLLRYARSHGPFTTGDVVGRYGLESDAVEILLATLENRDLLVRGELRPGGTEREWCDPDVLRRIRRASLAVLRREVEPTEQVALGRFLPAWHGIDRKATLREALVPLQGLAIPVSLWETEILPRRVLGRDHDVHPADTPAERAPLADEGLREPRVELTGAKLSTAAQEIVQVVRVPRDRAERSLDVCERAGIDQIPKLLLPEELAEELSVERQRLRAALCSGRVVRVHVGRDVVEEQ